jgi:hypothetical protein
LPSFLRTLFLHIYLPERTESECERVHGCCFYFFVAPPASQTLHALHTFTLLCYTLQLNVHIKLHELELDSFFAMVVCKFLLLLLLRYVRSVMIKTYLLCVLCSTVSLRSVCLALLHWTNVSFCHYVHQLA